MSLCILGESFTALHLGAQYNNPQGIYHLLEYNANRLIRNAIGNLPINIAVDIQYKLFTNPVNDDEWSVFPYLVERCEAKIENLLPGRRYIFKVRASNLLGFGEFCNISENHIQTKSSPPAPIDIINVVNKTHNYVTIGWNMPDSNGEAVNAFDVQFQSKKGSATGWQTAEIRVPGKNTVLPVPQFTLLKNVSSGDSFRFRVRSNNLIGWSTYGPVSEWIHIPFEDINDHGSIPETEIDDEQQTANSQQHVITQCE